jgi:hypothetical protein
MYTGTPPIRREILIGLFLSIVRKENLLLLVVLVMTLSCIALKHYGAECSYSTWTRNIKIHLSENTSRYYWPIIVSHPWPRPINYAVTFLASSESAVAMIGGGLGIFLRKKYRLMNQGSHTVNSWRMKSFVGTEKTSAICVRCDNSGYRHIGCWKELTV